MLEVAPGLWVGNDDDFKSLRPAEWWAVVHACKEPYHRAALGYTTRGAPQDHPEYLMARRGDVLCLNMVDADNPKFISDVLVTGALSFISEYKRRAWPVLIHCNEGKSRSPGLAMAYLAPNLPKAFEAAEREYRELYYPPYEPRDGIRGYLQENWERLRCD